MKPDHSEALAPASGTWRDRSRVEDHRRRRRRRRRPQHRSRWKDNRLYWGSQPLRPVRRVEPRSLSWHCSKFPRSSRSTRGMRRLSSGMAPAIQASSTLVEQASYAPMSHSLGAAHATAGSPNALPLNVAAAANSVASATRRKYVAVRRVMRAPQVRRIWPDAELRTERKVTTTGVG